MHFDAIDHIVLPVKRTQNAIEPFQKLGLRCIAQPSFLGPNETSRCLFIGNRPHLFHLELIEPAAQATHPLNQAIRRSVEESRGLCAVVLRVRGLNEQVEELKRTGLRAEKIPAAAGGNDDERFSVAFIPVEDEAGVPLFLCESGISVEDQFAQIEAEDGFNHALEVKRLDHLAAVARNLDAQTHFWTHFLRIPLFGEVVTPAMIIRQFKIGDAIIELLGPNSSDSPLNKRAPGLISMMSVEVANLLAAVERVRSAGLTISEPAAGVLPGTITATIPASEASGIALQLLQFA